MSAKASAANARSSPTGSSTGGRCAALIALVALSSARVRAAALTTQGLLPPWIEHLFDPRILGRVHDPPSRRFAPQWKIGFKIELLRNFCPKFPPLFAPRSWLMRAHTTSGAEVRQIGGKSDAGLRSWLAIWRAERCARARQRCGAMQTMGDWRSRAG